MENNSCKQFVKFIKDFDIFGHPVELNFNKNGPTHKTMIGGCVSLVYYIVTVCLVLFIVFDVGKDSVVNPANALIDDSDELQDLETTDEAADLLEEPDPEPTISYEPIKGDGPKMVTQFIQEHVYQQNDDQVEVGGSDVSLQLAIFELKMW